MTTDPSHDPAEGAPAARPDSVSVLQSGGADLPAGLGSYALSFTPFAAQLLGRDPQDAGGWIGLGEVRFNDPMMRENLAQLRQSAGADRVMVIIPDDQILYTTLDIAPDVALQDGVAAALDGLTPYAVEELVWDCERLSQSAQEPAQVAVAAVAARTLQEAQEFARAHGFEVTGFVALPEDGAFPRTAEFALTDSAQAVDDWADEPAGPITPEVEARLAAIAVLAREARGDVPSDVSGDAPAEGGADEATLPVDQPAPAQPVAPVGHRRIIAHYYPSNLVDETGPTAVDAANATGAEASALIGTGAAMGVGMGAATAVAAGAARAALAADPVTDGARAVLVGDQADSSLVAASGPEPMADPVKPRAEALAARAAKLRANRDEARPAPEAAPMVPPVFTEETGPDAPDWAEGYRRSGVKGLAAPIGAVLVGLVLVWMLLSGGNPADQARPNSETAATSTEAAPSDADVVTPPPASGAPAPLAGSRDVTASVSGVPSSSAPSVEGRSALTPDERAMQAATDARGTNGRGTNIQRAGTDGAAVAATPGLSDPDAARPAPVIAPAMGTAATPAVKPAASVTQPKAVPSTQPVEKPVTKPSPKPVDPKPVEKPVETAPSVAKPAAKPPVPRPTEKTTPRPSAPARPQAAPAARPQSVAEQKATPAPSAPRPAARPKPRTEKASRLASSAAKPATKPVAKPADKPVSRPRPSTIPSATPTAPSADAPNRPKRRPEGSAPDPEVEPPLTAEERAHLRALAADLRYAQASPPPPRRRSKTDAPVVPPKPSGKSKASGKKQSAIDAALAEANAPPSKSGVKSGTDARPPRKSSPPAGKPPSGKGGASKSEPSKGGGAASTARPKKSSIDSALEEAMSPKAGSVGVGGLDRRPAPRAKPAKPAEVAPPTPQDQPRSAKRVTPTPAPVPVPPVTPAPVTPAPVPVTPTPAAPAPVAPAPPLAVPVAPPAAVPALPKVESRQVYVRPPEADDEPEDRGAATKGVTPAEVARRATQKGVLRNKTTLVGVYGAGKTARGLVRTGSGRFVKVRVGDRFDGGLINGLGAAGLSYVKNGQQYTLPMLDGR